MEQTRVSPSIWTKLSGKLFSDKGLTKKAYLNTLAAGLDYATRFVIRFLVTPILLAGLGPVLFGVWEVIRKSTEYLGATGQSTQALKWFVVNRINSEDVQEKRCGVGGALAVSTIFLPIQLIAGAIVVWYAPVWFKAPVDAFWAVRISTAIVILGIVARGFTDVSRCVLEGENLGYKRMWISVVLVIVGGVLSVLAIKLGWGLVGVATALVATMLLTGLAFMLVVKTHVPWFGVSWPTKATVREFLGLSGWCTGWLLVNRVMDASDVVVLGVFATPELVTSYTLMRFLPEASLRFVTVVVFQTVPGLGKILGDGDVERAASARGEISLLTWLATTVVGATILLWNDNFLHLWIGETYSGGQLTTFLLVILMIQYVWIRIDADFINLDLQLLGPKVIVGAIGTMLSLLMGIALVKYGWGIDGICLGFILGRLVMTIGYPVQVGGIMKVGLGEQMAAACRPAIAMTLVLIGVSVVSPFVDVQGGVDQIALRLGFVSPANKLVVWLAFAVCVACSAVLLAVFSCFAGMTIVHRQLILSRVKKLIGT